MRTLPSFPRLAAVAAVLLLAVPAAGSAAPAPAKKPVKTPHPVKEPHLKEVVPFIENDLTRALAEAERRQLPVVVDAWATWCHTCRSMRAFVFTDPALADEADRFVWLALDVEKPQNAFARAKYPAEALPTFFVLDPRDGSIAAKWVGGMTAAQVKSFLRQGEAAVAAAHAAPGAADATPLARADRAYARGDYAAAAREYATALATPPADPVEDARAVEAALFASSMADETATGFAIASAASERLGRTTSGASAAAQGLGFALALPDTTPGRAEAIARFEAATRSFLDDPGVTLADDDRSGMLSTLMDARVDAKDEAGAKAAARAWATFLEGAAARAKTADQRAVFDSHRLGAYLELGEPAKAVPMLQASEKALPRDYNPPYRLAIAYNAMKRWNDALAATDRALANAYGPRKIRILTTRADAQAGRGDVAAARATMDEVIAFARGLPEGQVSAATIAGLEKKRDGMSAAP